MQALYGQPVFEVDGEPFCWEDVILAALRSDQWPAVEQAVREGLACVAVLEQNGQAEPEDEIEEAANQFRYDRDLLTADETEAWLARRGVTVEAWMDQIRRGVLREQAGDELETWMADWEPDPDELAEALRVDLLCGTEGAALALALAERAAGAAATERASDNGPTGAGIDGELRGLDPMRGRAVAARLDRIEAGWSRFEQSLAGAEAIVREVNRRQLDWLRIECQAIGFAEESQAREAALCVRDDGLSLDDVANDSHQAVVELRFLLDQAEPASRPLFLAAGPADLVGPIVYEDQHTLFRVLDKVRPSPDDPEIRELAVDALLKRATEIETQRRVRWLIS